MQLTVQNLQSMADAGTFSRGLDYFRRGKVQSVYYDEDIGSLFADVKGSARNIYAVEIFWEDGGVVSECSCPVGYNCKHGVAAGLRWLQQAQSDYLRGAGREDRHSAALGRRQMETFTPLQRWLADLPPARQGPRECLASGNHYLLYFLDFHFRKARISVKKGYLKKDGTWSQIGHHSPDFANLDWHRPAYMLDEDVDILRLLPRPTGMGYSILSGEAGGFVLKCLVASGRLHWAEDGNLVRQGPAIALEWQWTEAENGRRLTAQLTGVDDWCLLAVSPPCYLDTKRGRIGEITTPLEVARLEHLLSMPPVEEAQWPQVVLQLRRAIPREHLPLPQEPDLIVLNSPTPHLTAITCRVGNVRMPAWELHFDYRGFSLTPLYDTRAEEGELLQRDGRYYRIDRDEEAEDGCCTRMHTLGLCFAPELEDRENVWLPEGATVSDMLARWQDFVDRELPGLSEQGWVIHLDPENQLTFNSASFTLELRDASDHWFDFSLSLPVGDKHLNTTEVVEVWLKENTPDDLMLYVEGEWLRVDTRPLQTIRGLVVNLFNQNKLSTPARLPAFQAAQFQDVPDLDSRQAPLTGQLLEQLRDFTGLQPVPPSSSLQAQLRGYQQQGLDWLAFLSRYGLGGILADDMGLGKTLQTLALVQHLKDSKQLKKPALIVAPTSLTGNWLHEAARFTPSLKTTLIHGPDRAAAFKKIAASDLVITTYPLLIRDEAFYEKRQFSLLILDEAQAIKNPTTKIAKAVRGIESGSRLCLTGTPLENHLGELWALMDFALPGLLGGRKSFNESYRSPIEKERDQARQQELARIVAPFMLRRSKAEVVRELPEKTEIVQYVELNGQQRSLYESIRISMEKRIRDLVARQGMEKSHIAFLDALLKLRQACIDPRLVKLDEAANIKESAKLDWLSETLPQLIEEGRKILIFSQFTEALKLIEAILAKQKLGYSKLTGQTRKRQQAIDCFQRGEVPIFLVSLKAGGSGLNLTAADVVIHVDPWWNPAVENQATDRAYRIGQAKPVFVYKLVAAGTVEERMTQMQEQKRALAESLFSATGSVGLPSNKDDLLALLAR
jgi:superfamily II DNA or RNA helicase